MKKKKKIHFLVLTITDPSKLEAARFFQSKKYDMRYVIMTPGNL